MHQQFQLQKGDGLQWRTEVLQLLADQGFVVIKNVLPSNVIATAKQKLVAISNNYHLSIGCDGEQNAITAGHNELRLLFSIDPFFMEFLQIQTMLDLLYSELSDTAILRFQNGALSSPHQSEHHQLNSYQFHMNFPYRFEHQQKMFMEFIFPITTIENMFDLIPGSHQLQDRPSIAFLESNSINLTFQAGDMIIMTPFLWHREKPNHTDNETIYIHQQFSRPFIKQHIDYCRTLTADEISEIPDATLRLLGWYSRVPSSLKEFYLPKEQRYYRSGEW